jgi:hypothetical protein
MCDILRHFIPKVIAPFDVSVTMQDNKESELLEQ